MPTLPLDPLPQATADPILICTEALDDRLCEAIRRDGYVVCDDLLPMTLSLALSDDCRIAAAGGLLRPAAMGRAAGTHYHALRRGDSTLWLQPETEHPARTDLLEALDALRRRLNQRLLLGLESIEAHYALYPPGACYVRHLDRFHDADARVLSLATYLNPDWSQSDGGELRLHLQCSVLDVAPRLGTSVLFLSAEIEHEVLPAKRPRYSVSGWFRRRGSRIDA